MTLFVELEDGSIINLDHVVKLHPNSRSNRIEFVTGAHLQLIDADALKVREAMMPPPPPPPQIDWSKRTISNGTTVVDAEKPKKRRGRPPKQQPAT